MRLGVGDSRSLRVVGFVEMLLVAEVAGLYEIHDAPQIEQPVFQRRAGEREALVGLDLLHGLRDLRVRVLDELRFVEHHDAKSELVQLLLVAPQQGVVGDDDVVLGDLLAQVVARGTALEHEHLEVRRETLRLAPPVVQHRRGADDQRGPRIFIVLMRSHASQASVWSVLPRPMSSARMPPR